MKLWTKLNKIATEKFGEFGFSTLTEEQMKEVVQLIEKEMEEIPQPQKVRNILAALPKGRGSGRSGSLCFEEQ